MKLSLLASLLSCAAAFVAPSRHLVRATPLFVDADCVESESCSVEELNDLLVEVKSQAAALKALEEKLTKLNKSDEETIKSMLKADECELNGFDGCSAWFYDD